MALIQKNASLSFSNSFLPYRPQEKCGIFGIFGKDSEAARLVHSGLWALQHRGQESSGIASTEGKTLRVYKDEGLVAHVYDEEHLSLLTGHAAIGHNRYGTSGGSGGKHAQPILGKKRIVALAHNGNLPSTKKLEEFLSLHNIKTSGLNDSEMMQAVLELLVSQGLSITKAIKKAFPLFTGAFCLLILTTKALIAIRDERGIRPLCLGRFNGSFVLSSETCALDTIGAEFIREIKPGEMIKITKNGISSTQLAKKSEKLDIFEFVYFARPDSQILGQRVGEVRRRFGIQLAKEYKIKADVVIPVPDSAISAALGYAQESGVPFDHGLIKNRYIHRTFIRPAQKLREKDLMMKLNPMPEVIKDKRIIIIDDSIVRGSTAKKLVDRLVKAGAKEVHFLVSSPPVLFPDFYGIDTPKQKQLLAGSLTLEQMRKELKVNSLYFLSYRGLIEATQLAESNFCTSCFDGNYPLDIGELNKATLTYSKSPK